MTATTPELLHEASIAGQDEQVRFPRWGRGEPPSEPGDDGEGPPPALDADDSD